jgi:hypothetical protein
MFVTFDSSDSLRCMIDISASNRNGVNVIPKAQLSVIPYYFGNAKPVCESSRSVIVPSTQDDYICITM